MDVLEEQTSEKVSNSDFSNCDQDISEKNSLQSEISVAEYVTNEIDHFPPKPIEPLPEDCCGQGCQPCIFDIYQQQLNAWETECRRLKMAHSNSVSEGVLSPARWFQFNCTHIDSVTSNVNIYTFESTDCIKGFKFKPGQYIRAQSKLNCAITRAYTPLPGHDDHFSVMVKLYDDGLMSAFWKSVQVGDVVLWRGPYETGLSYSPNSYRHIVMFCAGTGIAPCYALAYHITTDEQDETFVRLVFSCKTRHDILLRDALHFLNENWNFTCRTVLTQDDCEGFKKRYGEDVSSGRITSDLVASELAGKTESVYVIICGTQSFNKDASGYVRQCGVLEENIKVL